MSGATFRASRSTCSEPGSDFAYFDLTYFLHLKNPGYTSPMISSSKTIPSMEGEDDVSGLAVDGQPSCAPHLPRQVRSHPVLLLLSPTTTAFQQQSCQSQVCSIFNEMVFDFVFLNAVFVKQQYLSWD